MGLPAVSVAHYGEQNGDLMRDPEMCFEIGLPISGKPFLDSYYYATTTPRGSSQGSSWLREWQLLEAAYVGQ
jgi:hypothetical protein